VEKSTTVIVATPNLEKPLGDPESYGCNPHAGKAIGGPIQSYES